MARGQNKGLAADTRNRPLRLKLTNGRGIAWADDSNRRNIVQTRLFAAIAGGLLGIVAASPINAALGLNPAVALIGCSSIGVAVGYVASILFDVFTASPKDKGIKS
jgi:hypothetical protein